MPPVLLLIMGVSWRSKEWLKSCKMQDPFAAPRFYTLQLMWVTTTRGHGQQRPHLICLRGKLKLTVTAEKRVTLVPPVFRCALASVTVTSRTGLHSKGLPSYNYEQRKAGSQRSWRTVIEWLASEFYEVDVTSVTMNLGQIVYRLPTVLECFCFLFPIRVTSAFQDLSYWLRGRSPRSSQHSTPNHCSNKAKYLLASAAALSFTQVSF